MAAGGFHVEEDLFVLTAGHESAADNTGTAHGYASTKMAILNALDDPGSAARANTGRRVSGR
ncbi:hypothetical protein AWC14_19320 [Mycobacterium kyorinense]|uniref:Uncharacterized protein n=1 Tax=Mycobacterium kyorinense TaxID=487514 RepID=A0A1X1YJ07_9MYCO|nr:hypothetical protein AWC14_19320 [Mycobacterium kyorinense]